MGYGFLEFENREKAKEALDTLNGKPMPNSIKVFKLNWASYNTNRNAAQNPNEFSIYVCELDASVTNEVLRDFFKEHYTSVIDAKIIIDPSTKISKGYGFVKFSNKEESEKARNEMDGKYINGKAMKTGNASYKNEKKQNNNNINNQQNLNSLQNDPNFILQQQPYLEQFYLANGYQQNIYPLGALAYQLYAQLMQQNANNQNQNLGNNLQNMGNNMGNDNMNLNQQFQGQDFQQFLNNYAMLQMMGAGNAGLGGDMNAMMGTNNENNQDN